MEALLGGIGVILLSGVVSFVLNRRPKASTAAAVSGITLGGLIGLIPTIASLIRNASDSLRWSWNALGGSLSRGGQAVALTDREGTQLSVLETAEQIPPFAIPAISDLKQALPFEIAPVRIEKISRQWFNGQVYNLATVVGWYVANGIVTHNCGFTSHDDADHADGSIRTIDEFEAYPVAHPRCVRSRGPVIEDSLAGNGRHEAKDTRCPGCRKLLVKDGAVKCDRCKEEVAV